MLDWSGGVDIIGKDGTDIIDGKCTWFAVQILLNSKNNIKFKENYANDDKINVIKDIYKEMNLKEECLLTIDKIIKEQNDKINFEKREHIILFCQVMNEIIKKIENRNF